MTVAVDVGGTFTDVVRWDGARITVVKTPSTADQSEGVAAGTADALEGTRAPLLVHGTTVATNALLERRGARVALVTDPGFEDVIEIGRQHRPSLYDPFADRPPPLVDRSLRLGLAGDPDEAARRLAGTDAQAVAVATLHGYRHPEREEQLLEALAAAGIGRDELVAAGRLVGEVREFERTSTAVLTAYLRPVVRRYLANLVDRVVPDLAERVLVMRSSGGLAGPDEAAEAAAGILLSGPAGGVVAAARLGEALGSSRLISFDMGGTSTDVCRVEGGRPEVTYQREVDGYVCRMPSVAVHTVGAGGGSLGWLDPGGALRVGPRSAGADPGPAGYGRGGTEPAVTDANLALSRIDPAARLGGTVDLSLDAALAALSRLGEAAGIDGPRRVAEGMLEVVETHMERAVRRVSVEEGSDPRESVLVAFGGAGGLHASALARRLEMRGVVIPAHAGVFSALGLLLSPPRVDLARSVLLTADDAGRVDPTLSRLAADATAELERRTGVSTERTETVVDVRYLGQSHETAVPYTPGEGWEVLADRFHRLHRERNGFARPGDPVEAVTLRATATGAAALDWADLPEHRPEGEARRGSRPVVVDGEERTAEVWWRPGMRPGDEVAGPAVVEEPDSTTFLHPGDRARLHPTGALEVEW